jgi:catechol 1,2-dioxygenase
LQKPQENVLNEKERIISIWRASCDAMQRVVRELEITETELLIAGRFFNRLGQSGMFPSLVTVGLVMTSVDVRREAQGGTRPNPEGPFHKPGAPYRTDGNLLDRELGPEAVELLLEGRVVDAETGKPLSGAEIDFWQADDSGIYDNVGFHLRGIVRTDAQGRYRVRTIVPRDYAEHDGDPIGELFRAMGRHNRRAGHMHLKVRCADHLPLITQLYMPDSQYLDSDYVEGAVSPDLTLEFLPRESKGARRAVDAHFDISLRRAEATLNV